MKHICIIFISIYLKIYDVGNLFCCFLEEGGLLFIYLPIVFIHFTKQLVIAVTCTYYSCCHTVVSTRQVTSKLCLSWEPHGVLMDVSYK